MTENAPAAVPEPSGGIVLFQTRDGKTRIEVRHVRETERLALSQVAELFQREPLDWLPASHI